MSALVIFLLDESQEMNVPAARSSQSMVGAAPPRTKAQHTATAVNSLLERLSGVTGIDIALVGYRSNSSGEPVVGSRWSGSVVGQSVLYSEQLSSAVLRIETRTKKTAGPVGMQAQPVAFNVWYDAPLEGKAPQIAAFRYCKELIEQHGCSESMPVLMVHVSASASGDGNPQQVIKEIMGLNGSPIILQTHLAAFTKSDALPATLFPANRAFLPPGSVRDLYDRSSPLPDLFAAKLRQAKFTLNVGARGMVYNGKLIDLTHLLSLVYSFAEANQSSRQTAPENPPSVVEELVLIESTEDTAEEPMAPPAEPELVAVDEPVDPPPPLDLSKEAEVKQSDPATERVDAAVEVSSDTLELVEAKDEPKPPEIRLGRVSADRPAVVGVILDRSATDPYVGDLDSACARLEIHLSELLGKLTKLKDGTVDVVVVSYGTDAAGQVEVRDTVDGYSGKRFVKNDQLESIALRVEDFIEERASQGRIMQIPHRRVFVVEVEPTVATPAATAFARMAELLTTWSSEHRDSAMPPIVVHLTRGEFSAGDVDESVNHLKSVSTAGGPAILYHWVATESDIGSLRYPDRSDQLPTSHLAKLWQCTSPLLLANELASLRSHIEPRSRGMIVNHDFDQLLYPIREAIED